MWSSGSATPKASASSSPTMAAKISSSTNPPSDPKAFAPSSKAIASSFSSPAATPIRPKPSMSPALTAPPYSPSLETTTAAAAEADSAADGEAAIAVTPAPVVTSAAMSAT